MNPSVRSTAILIVLLAVSCSGIAMASDSSTSNQLEIGPPVTPFVFDGDVRDLPPVVQWQPGDPIKEIPRRYYPKPGHEAEAGEPTVAVRDLLADEQRLAPDNTTRAFTTPDRNFPGQPYSGVNPPDTAGDVGPAHYIQMINAGGGATVRIYDKSLPTPSALATFSLDSLGSGNCASGFGDPIVIYDRLADRWMLTEFSSSGNRLCVYISQSSDPVAGGWFNYNYQAPSFPDYPKYGVWPTDSNGGLGSYVVTANDGGPGVYALDRGAMLAGSPGTYQRMTIPGLPGFGFEAATPPDMDGPTPPPTGTPAIVMRHRDTESHSGPAAPADLLELWAFDVDWVTPGNTTLNQLPSIDVAEFDSATCGLTSFFCFPQPGSSTTLDPLREVVMNRLQYYNHGDYETLVGNFVIDVNGADHGGIRWFELRREGAAWTLHQEGTYSIDATNRWMGASSMDQSGNIALAYSVSSSSVFPGLRYTGRMSSDPLGVMTQSETVIHAGTAANSSNRWGDYAAMNLDPTDDCTFWFTSLDNTSNNWRTQIASFAFDACGCLLAPSPSSASAGAVGDNRIDIGWDDADLAEVVEYRVRRSTTPGGTYSTIATLPDSSPGVAGGAGYVYQDTSVSGGTTYYYTIVSSDGVACTSDASNETSATASGACTLAPTFAGLHSVTSPFSSTCALDLNWSAASANCAGPISYNIYRSPEPESTPSLLVSGVAATSYSDLSGLDSDEDYFYTVRAIDVSNGVDDGNTEEVVGIPQGEFTNGTWSDDAGDSGMAKMTLNGPWGVNSTEGVSGSGVYKTGTYNSNTCAGLVTPELQLGTGSQLSFSSRYDIESSWDKGEVQISPNGVIWERVPVNYPGNSSNTSDNCGLPTGSYFTGEDNTFRSYSASLAAWSGQTVFVRFVLSTDSSVVGNGWWIDNIQITEVDVPGECTTGSNCAENPFVNVLPDGPFEACLGEQTQLTASLTGGVGPFSYQWTRDGVPIVGATDSTLDANDSGSHAYNVLVTGDGCVEGATDGAATLGSWRDAPEFGGIVPATNAQQSTCAIDLNWNAAVTVCAGPVTYDVYRSTAAVVGPVPANLVASGLIATDYTDNVGLNSGEDYNYLVRAADQSTGQSDGNTVQASGVPTAAGGGLQTLFEENFDNPFGFGAWTVTTGPGPHTCGAWTVAHGANQRPANSDGNYLLADSNQCGSGSQTSASVASPVVDGDIAGLSSATLDLEMYYNDLNGDDASIEVWDGSGWQTLWSDSNTDLDIHQTWDVTTALAGNSDFQFRFDYQNAANDAWFSADDIELTLDVQSVCETGSGTSAPPPVADGSEGTTPLGASRITPNGDALEVNWDVVSCPATDYNLLYGTLSSVSSHALDGSVCDIGTTGSLNWTGVPSGSLYFLIVGDDDAGRESSWGTGSDDLERGGAASSGECSVTLKDTSLSCPG